MKGSLDQALFAAELEFRKILVSRLPQKISHVNNECIEKLKQQHSLCGQLLEVLIYLHFIVLILMFLIDFDWCELY